jgi:hypothetical protein
LAAAEYAEMYQRSSAVFPEEAVSARLRGRMTATYPFHQTLIDFLNNKLALAENFQSLFNISACADWRDRFFALQGKKPQQSISCNDPIEGSCTIILHRRSMRLLQNPDGLQGFLTQSGRKICRQGGRGEMLNRL